MKYIFNIKVSVRHQNSVWVFSSTNFRYITIFNGVYVSVCSMSFGIGNCLLLISFAKRSKSDLQLVNVCTKSRESQLLSVKHLKLFIEFHIDAKQLSILQTLLISSENQNCFHCQIHISNIFGAHRDFSYIFIGFFWQNFSHKVQLIPVL